MPIELGKTYYTYSDLSIVPSAVSKVSNAGECCPYYDDGMLPVFASPTDTVVSQETYDKTYGYNRVNAILPMTIPHDERVHSVLYDGKWAAFSLNEFNKVFCGQYININGKARVMIETKYGSMEEACSSIERAKSIQGDNIVIMCGNVENPKSYTILSESGADYIVFGGGRTMAHGVGVHVPIASLIDEVSMEREKMALSDGNCAMVIADGEITCESDIIKALALGADYVMVGDLFMSMLDSPAEKYVRDEFGYSYIKIEQDIYSYRCSDGIWYRSLYGDEWERVGKIFSKIRDTASSRYAYKMLEVKNLMDEWSRDLENKIKESMAYCGTFALSQFKGSPKIIVNSSNACQFKHL